MLQHILSPDGVTRDFEPWPLYSVASTRVLEQQLAAQLPPHTPMARAGSAAADMARAIAPHARSIWIACGPGNNGGDGLMAAALLAPWAVGAGVDLTVSWCANEASAPADARQAWQQAVAAGVRFVPGPPEYCDLGIDALLGIGGRVRATPSPQRDCIQAWTWALQDRCGQRLSLDVPTGLCADTGNILIATNACPTSVNSHFCLTFISLKTGLFTGQGRDMAGHIWLDDLGLSHSGSPPSLRPSPDAWLGMPGRTLPCDRPQAVAHHTHKGLLGDVWVLGGQGKPHGQGMAGAAILAARGALHARAGRVFVALLDTHAPSWDSGQPELMLRDASSLLGSDPLPMGTWVGGCGGGSAIRTYLPKLLDEAQALVLDADALNAIAASSDLRAALQHRGTQGKPTVITPHPLEAARLLGSTTPQVQADRTAAARQLAAELQCICVLKGSGTVSATPSGLVCVNPSGNGRLSTAGTGDVLAGVMGAALAAGVKNWPTPFAAGNAAQAWVDGDLLAAVTAAVWSHGLAADQWPPTSTLTASALAACISPPASSRFATATPVPTPTSPRPPPGE